LKEKDNNIFYNLKPVHPFHDTILTTELANLGVEVIQQKN